MTLNQDCLLAGQIRNLINSTEPPNTAAKACRVAVGAVFEIPELG